jgi:O-acetyl-ADP-ribose deacetylase (regulator of RNase III)
VPRVPTIFQKGDILHTDGLKAFAHGCNAQGTMDSGVSLAFKKAWPAMHEEVARRVLLGQARLGEVLTWSDGSVTVYSLVIQDGASKKAKMTALTRALTTMIDLATTAKIERIGMPRIGAGKAGLDFTRVKKLLTELGDDKPITLIVFDQFVRAPAAPAPSE